MAELAMKFSAVLLFAALVVSKPLAKTDDPDRAVTEVEYERGKTELSNWGRWGEDDEIGAEQVCELFARWYPMLGVGIVGEDDFAVDEIAREALNEKLQGVDRCADQWTLATGPWVVAGVRLLIAGAQGSQQDGQDGARSGDQGDLSTACMFMSRKSSR